MLFVCMHPLNNVPPPLNAAIHFGKLGHQVIVIAYYDEGLPRIERLGTGARLLRVSLRSRRLKISVLRYVFAIVEFLWKSRSVSRRIKPQTIITFNEIASILHSMSLQSKRCAMKKIAWLLEFPENLEKNLGKSLIFNLSIWSWKQADIVIAPSRERLAMACVLQPQLIHKRLTVVHNASLAESVPVLFKYSAGFYQVKAFVEDSRRAGHLKIIYAGAIGNRYGLRELILAIGNSDKAMSLLVLGKKHSLSLTEYEESIATVKFPNRIQWIDSIDYREMMLILPLFDVGYVTYIGDSLNTYFSAPGKLYEYLKAGLIILTDVGVTVYDDLQRHHCAIFFDKPVDQRQLQAGLEAIAGQSEKVASMRCNAKGLFLERYCFEKQISQLADSLIVSEKG